jgi:hypothetical protein
VEVWSTAVVVAAVEALTIDTIGRARGASTVDSIGGEAVVKGFVLQSDASSAREFGEEE